MMYDELDDALRQVIDAHVATCEMCRHRLTEVRAMQQWIHQAQAQQPQPRHAAALTHRIMNAVNNEAAEKRTKAWFPWLHRAPMRYALLASSLLLVVLGVGEWQRSTTPPPRQVAASETVVLKTLRWQQWQVRRKQPRTRSLYACAQSGNCPPPMMLYITSK